MIDERKRFSYISDPNVPDFGPSKLFTVMDANCALCAKGAKWIAKHDRPQEFTIIPIQSGTGRALLTHYGLDPDDPTSWLFVQNGQAFSSIDAVIRVGHRLGGVWRGLYVLRVIPKFLQDRLYRFVAQNRYKFFGATDMCALPDPEVRKRLLE